MSVSLSADHALVLFEWLGRVADRDDCWDDQAERRAVWDLTASLAALLPVFADNYGELVRLARERTRDSLG